MPKDVLKLADYETRILYLQWRASECKEHIMENNDKFKEYAQVRYNYNRKLNLQDRF